MAKANLKVTMNRYSNSKFQISLSHPVEKIPTICVGNFDLSSVRWSLMISNVLCEHSRLFTYIKAFIYVDSIIHGNFVNARQEKSNCSDTICTKNIIICDKYQMFLG